MEESQGHEGKFVRGEGQVGRVKKIPNNPFGSESSGQKLGPLTHPNPTTNLHNTLQ